MPEPSSSRTTRRHRLGSTAELSGYWRSIAQVCLRRDSPELCRTSGSRKESLLSSSAATASAEEKRRPGVRANHQTTPTLAENTSSVPPSTGWSRRSVHRPNRAGLRSAIECCGSEHHREPRRADAGDASSRSPATARHRSDHPWPAGIKRLPELRQRLRVDRIQVQKIDMHQRIDQCSTLLLDSNGDGATSEAIPQLLNPVLQGFRRLIQTEALPLFTVSFLQSNNMFLVGPIQADECSDFDIRFRYLHISPSFPRFKTIPAGSAHNPYSRVLEGHHLSIRSTSRTDRVRKSPLTVDSVGWLIRNATQPVFHKGLAKKRKTNQKTKQKTACGKCRSYGHPQTKQWPSAASA